MGKRAEDLPLDDTPIQPPEPPDDRDTEWYRFIVEIDDLASSGEYDWAVVTLNGIRETVEKTRRVSEGQRRAVTNIEASKREPRRDGFRRRYEGWR